MEATPEFNMTVPEMQAAARAYADQAVAAAEEIALVFPDVPEAIALLNKVREFRTIADDLGTTEGDQ